MLRPQFILALCSVFIALSPQQVAGQGFQRDVNLQQAPGPAPQAGDWNLQDDNVCWSAVNKIDSATFTSNYTGIITGVRLERILGGQGVTCRNDLPFSNWGCYFGGTQGYFATLITQEYETVLYPNANDPRDGTQVDLSSFLESRGAYFISSEQIDNPNLYLYGEMYVEAGAVYEVGYNEAVFNFSTEDNVGMVCARVYFQY